MINLHKNRSHSPGLGLMVFAVFFASILLLFPSNLEASELSPLDGLSATDSTRSDQGLGYFENARRDLWTGEVSQNNFVRLLDQAESAFSSINNRAAREYLMARVLLYRGRGELTWGKKADARALFEESMDLAKSSIEQDESAEALRVLADAGSSWMITKGLGGIIKMAPQVQEWSDRSLELDPSNPLALIINAQGQINAPKSAGGDPEAAARRLNALVARRDMDDISLFWGRVSLAQAYDKLKERAEAQRWCELASEVFPEGPMLEDCP